MSVAAGLVGFALIVAGVALLAGAAIALIVAGVLMVVLGEAVRR